MTLNARQALFALVALMLVVGALGWMMSFGAGPEPSENRAVIDEAETAEVSDAVSQALTGVLSYDFANPAASEKIADNVLVGDAREEYDTLVASLHEKAPKQRLVLSAQVRAAAVKTLEGDTAELLVFLDQTSRRAKGDESSVSAAQLAIDAKKVEGAWRITGLEPL